MGENSEGPAVGETVPGLHFDSGMESLRSAGWAPAISGSGFVDEPMVIGAYMLAATFSRRAGER